MWYQLGAPNVKILHDLGVIWKDDSRKNQKRQVPKKLVFLENIKMLVLELWVTPRPLKMSGHAGPREPFVMEN